METEARDRPVSPKEVFGRITVSVRSDDRAVVATFTPASGMTVRLDSNRLPDHTDTSLARQIEDVLNRTLTGSHRAREMAMAKAFGKPTPAPKDSREARIAAERQRRAHDMLAASDMEGISPLTEVRVGFHVDDGFTVDIKRGAVRGNAAEVLEAEINAAVLAAMTEYRTRLLTAHDAVFNRMSNTELEKQSHDA